MIYLRKKIILLIVILVLIKISLNSYQDPKLYHIWIKTKDSKIYPQVDGSLKSVFENVKFSTKNTIDIFDLNQADLENYTNINCRKSAEIYVKTTLCIHDVIKDSFVSKDIMNNGVWEPKTARAFLTYVNKNPEWLVFDLGAQIGQYTLFAAKMGSKVVTVEPFYENIIRIHKASTLEKLQDRITLVRNAVSGKANEIKRLYENNINIGGQGIIKINRKFYDFEMKKDKYLVKTIVFNDLLDYLPITDDGQKFQKAIMKIDIEGYEPYAFEKADKLFDTIDVQVIFMEWGNLPPLNDRHKEIVNMIDFLLKKNLLPRDENDKILEKEDWKDWPWDIIWVNSNLQT